MNFNKHLNYEGLHAPFGPSQSSWLRYSTDKIVEVYKNKQAKEMGTRLHAWAKETIDLGMRQPRSDKTIYKYINDAIGFRMKTEVVLYYSDYFFGTADAISFRKNILRIHDLKTGTTPVKMEQLLIYAALFCLEYRIKPGDIKFELRIYQNDDIEYAYPEAEDILPIMDDIVTKNKALEKYEYEGV